MPQNIELYDHGKSYLTQKLSEAGLVNPDLNLPSEEMNTLVDRNLEVIVDEDDRIILRLGSLIYHGFDFEQNEEALDDFINEANNFNHDSPEEEGIVSIIASKIIADTNNPNFFRFGYYVVKLEIEELNKKALGYDEKETSAEKEGLENKTPQNYELYLCGKEFFLGVFQQNKGDKITNLIRTYQIRIVEDEKGRIRIQFQNIIFRGFDFRIDGARERYENEVKAAVAASGLPLMETFRVSKIVCNNFEEEIIGYYCTISNQRELHKFSLADQKNGPN